MVMNFIRAGRLSSILAIIGVISGLIALFCQFHPQPSIAAENPVQAIAARVSGDATRSRFETELDRPVSYSVYVLPDPYRVMIDLPQVTFNYPEGTGSEGQGLISAYRYGEMGGGRSRIVMDAEGPVLIEKSYIVKSEDGQPARIVVDLVKTDEKTFLMTHAAEPPVPDEVRDLPDLPKSSDETTGSLVPLPLPKPGTSADKPSFVSTQPPAKRDGRRVIVIDPGHGGIDPGAIGLHRTREKDVVLAFSLVLRDKLKASGKYEVVMTRTTDSFVTLKQRVRLARDKQADLFIAVHADTVRGHSARGATLYTLSEKATDAEAEELAQEENRADIIGGVDLGTESEEVTDILIDLAQRETKNHSRFFAKKAVIHLGSVTHLTGKPMRSAGFVVLKAPDVPSVLLELGYLTSKADEKLLNSPKWRRDVAAALTKAIDAYFSTEIAARQ
jgi:N-acetylmuramoyl-L-alanine amidase